MANSVDDGARPASAGQQSNPDRENGTAVSSMTAAASRSSAYDYEFSDIDEITMRQLNEDILAYNYDLDYCRAQLEEADLTPQETRTLQLRMLDLGHQIRHCKHRIQTLKFQTRGKQPLHRPGYGAPPAANHGNGTKAQHGGINGGSSAGLVPVKRTSGAALPAFTPAKRPLHDSDPDPSSKRIKTATSPDPDFMHFGEDGSGGVNTSLQRLGFWKCRLCSAPKYLLAGAGRSPAAPCKWPLKDISKMITHFTEMHAEHSPSERCAELGAALSQNRKYLTTFVGRGRNADMLKSRRAIRVLASEDQGAEY